jgi:cytochrome c peroxidase
MACTTPTRAALIVLLGVSLIIGCKHEAKFPEIPLDLTLRANLETLSPSGKLDHFLLPESTNLALIPQDPKNPLNKAKVDLGKMLFFEPGIGIEAKHPEGMRTYSCATCHTPEAGFRIGRFQGIADGAMGMGYQGDMRQIHSSYAISELDVQGARPLSVLNVSQVENTMWSGAFGSSGNNVGTESKWVGDFAANLEGFKALESQNFVGLVTHRQDINPQMAEAFGYTELFNEAFPELNPADRINRKTASLAISAYLRTLNTTKAPFQRWLRGFTDDMNDEQKKGAILFFGKANCARCHNGANLGGNTFHALGVKDLYQHTGTVGTDQTEKRNKGRAMFTQEENDLYKFRVPQLYNLKHSPFFFHGSSKSSLEEVIDYKCAAVSENENVPNDQLSPFFKPVTLTAEEKAQLIAFLRDGLYDAEFKRFVPEKVGSGLCFPNNDPISRVQMGCE